MEDDIPISPKGKKKIEQDVRYLKNEKRPLVASQMEEYRKHGDLSENAPYHAAREELAMIDSKVLMLEDKLARSYIVNRSELPDDMVVFGTRIELLEVNTKQKISYELVGAGEDDHNNNRILTTSPLGEALMLHKVNDVIDFEAPGGKYKYKILSIAFTEEDQE